MSDDDLQKMLDEILDHSTEPCMAFDKDVGNAFNTQTPMTDNDTVRFGIQTIGLSTEKLLSLIGHLYPLTMSLMDDNRDGYTDEVRDLILKQIKASWDIATTAESQIRERALSGQADGNDPTAEAMEAVIAVTDNLLPYRRTAAAAVVIVILNRVLPQELDEHQQAFSGVIQELHNVKRDNATLYACFVATLSEIMGMTDDVLTRFRTHTTGDKSPQIKQQAKEYNASFLASCNAGITPEDAATQLTSAPTGTMRYLTGLGHMGYALRDPGCNRVLGYWFIRRGATALILDQVQYRLNSGLHQLVNLYALATAHSKETGAQVLDALERITGTCMAPLSHRLLVNVKGACAPHSKPPEGYTVLSPASDYQEAVQSALKRWEVFAQTLPEDSLTRRVGGTGFHTFLNMFSAIDRDAQALYGMLETVFVNQEDAMAFMLKPYTGILAGIPFTVQTGIARFAAITECKPTRVQQQLQAQYASGIAAGINIPVLLDNLASLGVRLHDDAHTGGDVEAAVNQILGDWPGETGLDGDR